MKSLAALVKERRGNLGLRAAAKEAGISHATLSRIERGYPVDVDTLAKLFKWLPLDPREFFDAIYNKQERT